MIFAKNQDVYFLPLKCKTTPLPTKSAGTSAKSEYTSKACHKKTRGDMHIPDGLLLMWGVDTTFRFHISVAASQKNPFSALQKWKRHFS
jgi:hypothetical protein